ncbi:hypothetical protein AALP_AA8G391600 [Arabis alpina]|uniref:Protein kinase domain-containing protein n=1 Tax=Arabis alpina TaxID=50452 RepID=A0A087GCA2_ARAAL|nr:hypothetical protein AALP_AA8G391600 [Arabis alpina]
MERSLGLLLLLISTLAIIHIVHAQSQQGILVLNCTCIWQYFYMLSLVTVNFVPYHLTEFINLDCGQPSNEPYEEEKTGLQFTSDATFIQSGETGKVEINMEGRYLKPYRMLRYFPEGRRNCYNLKVEKGRNHLIRAWFMYGNYDGLHSSPKFDLYLGPNRWSTIDLEGQVDGTRKEILHIPTSNSLQICLVQTGTTIPMISALEIRPMRNDSYITTSGSLNLSFRVYLTNLTSYLRYQLKRTVVSFLLSFAVCFGSDVVPTLRSPFDDYDRQWNPYSRTEWTHISTTLEVDNSNKYVPPNNALKNAATPTNANAPLTIEWSSDNPEDLYYLYAHFAEIQDLRATDTREFNILLNEEHYYGPLIPAMLSVSTILSRSLKTCKGGKCSFQLVRTSRSTLPPLLNALEVYSVIQLLQTETNQSDVTAVKNVEATYGLSRINWQGDPCFPQELRWEGLNCTSTNMFKPPRITTLNLSSSGLTGTIAAAIKNLTQLNTLDLSNNSLTGEVPEFLGNMKSLLVINLSGNDLNGSVPESLQRKGLELLFEGNPRLSPPGSSTKQHGRSVLIPIVASVGSAAILIGVLVLFLVFRKKKSSTVKVVHPPSNRPTVNATSANSSEPSIETKKRRFTHSEVLKMTNNFERVVGEGGFGVVCHGTVNGSEQVAVKLLSQSSAQGYKEFKAEVVVVQSFPLLYVFNITKLMVHHTNLVSLVGYCDERDHLALIYEFIPNGDLRQHLSGTRLKIALEAALGLEYLHIGCTPPMVHRDVKTTNILLDENYKAKIADFGLSRSFPVGGETHVSTVVAGTPGYLDPEYYQTSRLGEKSDVYSFGIVLLEMITNQPVIDRNRRNSHITQWVGTELNGGDITKIMDPKLNRDYDSRSAWRALKLAMLCVNPTSARRPTMSHVVIELKECIASENSRENMSQGKDSLASPEVSMVFDSGMIPRARYQILPLHIIFLCSLDVTKKNYMFFG